MPLQSCAAPRITPLLRYTPGEEKWGEYVSSKLSGGVGNHQKAVH